MSESSLRPVKVHLQIGANFMPPNGDAVTQAETAAIELEDAVIKLILRLF